MKKEFSLPKATYDTFTIQELMTGKHNFSKYENWEEYTGLTDKNGVEIYEWDIIKWQDMNGDVISVVEFKDGGFHLKRNGLSVYIIAESCEVIGNIYENPELIRGEITN